MWWPPAKVAGPYLGAWLVRPHEPGLEKLQIEDRDLVAADDEATALEEREAALDLALAMADGEARYGDWRAALRALDAAEALAGALPPDYAQRRDLAGRTQRRVDRALSRVLKSDAAGGARRVARLVH